MAQDFTFYFDNAGGVVLECGDYKHYYDDGEQAGQDAVNLINGEDPTEDGWDGDEPDINGENSGEGCVKCNDLRSYKLSDWEKLSSKGASQSNFVRAFLNNYFALD